MSVPHDSLFLFIANLSVATFSRSFARSTGAEFAAFATRSRNFSAAARTNQVKISVTHLLDRLFLLIFHNKN
jgi:hypothetical protein